MRRVIRTRPARVAAALLAIAAVVGVALVGIAAWELSQQLDRARDGLPSNVLRRGVAPRSGDALHLLVIGVDRSSSGDGVQLVRVEPGGRLRILSIPRDLLLDAHDGGERAATIFHQQGPAALVRAVGRTTDVPIHRVLVIRLTAMREAIDAIGPVVVDNPALLETREIAGREWTFPAGRTELDGREAEAFMRARHNEADPEESDADRSRRQQLVLAAMLGSIGPLDVLRRPRGLPRDLLRGVATNLTLGELVQVARAARRGTVRCQLAGQERSVSATDPDLPWPARRDGIFLVPDPADVATTVAAWRDDDSAACR